MISRYSIAFFTCILGVWWSSAQYNAGLQTISVDGRLVNIQTPTNYNASDTYPVLFALHPTNGNRDSMVNQSLVDTHHYIGVYPEGETLLGVRYFNAYNNELLDTGVDDVAFLTHVYNTVMSNANIHVDSVYVHGYSNGGVMAYKMARETTLFRGMSIRAGGEELGNNIPHTAPKIPIIHIHGQQDTTVPFDGGISDFALFGGLTNFKSTEETLKSWFLHNNCNIRPSFKSTEFQQGQNNAYELREYYDCQNPRKLQMRFYKITNGMHNTSNQGFGYTHIINLTWDFFRNNQ